MKKLVIDIETVGTPWEEHDSYVREYLIKGMNEAEAEEEKRRGALSPFTGRIVAIGVVNAETGKSCAMYEVPGQKEVITEKVGLRTYVSGTEKQILEKFWEFFEPDSRFITFNGRQFDGPFLMIRSAINGVVPRRDLVGYRYQMHPNCDLREALNFYGTTNSRQFKFNLDLACKVFNIPTSKGEGLDGRSVETWYRAGKHREIADYCLDDVRATAERLIEALLERPVELDGVDERHAFGEEGRQHAGAGPDLEDDVVGRKGGEALDHPEQVLVDEEVLAEAALGLRQPAHCRPKAARALAAVRSPSSAASSPRAAASAATVWTTFAGSLRRPRSGCGERYGLSVSTSSRFAGTARAASRSASALP
jgi:DNA polymerase III epsilon subunit-like protein